MKQFFLLTIFFILFTAHRSTGQPEPARQELDSIFIASKQYRNEEKFDLFYSANIYGREKALTTVGRIDTFYLLFTDNLITYYFRTKEYEKSLPYALECYEVAKGIWGLENAKVDYYAGTLTFIYYRLKKYHLVIQNIQERLDYLENAGQEHTVRYANLTLNLAATYRAIGRLDLAIPLYEKALQIAQDFPDKDHPLKMYLQNLAVNYDAVGAYEKSLELKQRLLVIFEEEYGANSWQYADALSNLSFSYNYLGQIQKSLDLLNQAKQIFKQTGNDTIFSYHNLIINISINHIDLEQYDEALKYAIFEDSVFNYKKWTQTYPYVINLASIFICHSNLGHKTESAIAYENFIEAGTKVMGTQDFMYNQLLINAIIWRMHNGDIAEARQLSRHLLDYFEQAVGEGYRGYSTIALTLAYLYDLEGQQDSASYYYRRTNNWFVNEINRRFDFLSESFQSSFYQSLEICMLAFESYAFQHRKDKQFAEMYFDNSLLTKGLLMTNRRRLLQSLRNTHDETIRTMFDEWESLNQALAFQYSQPRKGRPVTFDSLVNESEKMEQALRLRSTEFRVARQLVNWRDVQQQLISGEVVIEFISFPLFSGRRNTDSIMYAALVLRPGSETSGPQFTPLFEEKSLKNLMGETAVRRMDYVANLYQSSPARGITPDSVGGKSLYELIWAPLQPALEGVKTIYYSPSGILHRLNMGAVAVNEDSLLSDRYELVRLGSTRQLVTAPAFAPASQVSAGREASTDKTAIVYGGVRYDMDSTAIGAANAAWNHDDMATNRGELSFTYTDSTLRGGSWEYLKWTEKEAAAVASILTDAGIPVEVRKGYVATEESFKQIGKDKPSPRILHISTHGFFFPDPKETADSRQLAMGSSEPVFKISDHPMIRSGLILAGANYAWKAGKPLRPDMDDGILTAYEISQMDLSGTELVVLSACETGLGDIAGNEGVYGLQRAFKIAGARYLIMSLWQVPDFQTQELMSAFYRKWLKERLPVRDALEAAQQEMRQKGLEPYYWAGFVLVE